MTDTRRFEHLNIRDVITPVRPGEGTSNETTPQPYPKKEVHPFKLADVKNSSDLREWLFHTRAGKATLATITTLSLAGIVGGVVGATASERDNGSVVEVEVEDPDVVVPPVNEPEEPETPVEEPVEKPPVVPGADVEELAAIDSLQEFGEYPKSEQLTYWSYLAESEDFREFVDHYRLVSEQANAVIPDTMKFSDIENKDIRTLIDEADASSFFGASFAFSFDPQSIEGQKALYAVFANNEHSQLYKNFAKFQEKQPVAFSGRVQGLKQPISRGAIDYDKSSTEVLYTSKGVPYIDLAIVAKDGTYDLNRFYAIPIKNSYFEGWDMMWVPEHAP